MADGGAARMYTIMGKMYPANPRHMTDSQGTSHFVISDRPFLQQASRWSIPMIQLSLEKAYVAYPTPTQSVIMRLDGDKPISNLRYSLQVLF